MIWGAMRGNSKFVIIHALSRCEGIGNMRSGMKTNRKKSSVLLYEVSNRLQPFTDTVSA